MPPTIRGDTKAHILKAARMLLTRGGLQAMTMRAIATDVGISAAGLYRHYTNREEILEKLAANELQRLHRSLLLPTTMKSWLKELETTIARYLNHAFNAPELFAVMLGSDSTDPAGGACNEWPDSAALLHERVHDILARAMPREEARTVAYGIVAATHGIIALTPPDQRRRAKLNQRMIAARVVRAVTGPRR